MHISHSLLTNSSGEMHLAHLGERCNPKLLKSSSAFETRGQSVQVEACLNVWQIVEIEELALTIQFK